MLIFHQLQADYTRYFQFGIYHTEFSTSCNITVTLGLTCSLRVHRPRKHKYGRTVGLLILQNLPCSSTSWDIRHRPFGGHHIEFSTSCCATQSLYVFEVLLLGTLVQPLEFRFCIIYKLRYIRFILWRLHVSYTITFYMGLQGSSEFCILVWWSSFFIFSFPLCRKV